MGNPNLRSVFACFFLKIDFFTQRIGFFHKKMIFYKVWPKGNRGWGMRIRGQFFHNSFLKIDFLHKGQVFFIKKWFFIKFDQRVIGGGESESEVSFFIFFFENWFFTQRTGFFHKKWFFIKFDQRVIGGKESEAELCFSNRF